jgi:hypothetical protein
VTTSIAYFVGDELVLDEGALANRFRVFQTLHSSVESTARITFKKLLLELLELYVTQLLGRAKYERRSKSDQTMIGWRCNRCGSQMRAHFTRNGHYRRGIATSWGYVAAVRIPMIRCTRCGGYVEVSFPFLPKYVRVWDDLTRLALLDCAGGLSLRRQNQRQLELGHVPLSLQTINRQVNMVVRALPILLGAPFSEVPPVVQLDGIYFTLLERTMQVKRDALGRLRRRLRQRDNVALVALGLWPDGRHKILGWTLAASEDSDAWRDFLLSLYQRGLRPENGLRLGSGDGAAGLREAWEFVYYSQLPLNWCHFHKIQRIVHRDYLLEQAHRGDILRDAGFVLEVPNQEKVYARLDLFCQKWGQREPHSVRIFQHNFAHCLTYLHVEGIDPVEFARTTSHIERVMRELRRKLSQVGTLMTKIGAQATMTLLSTRLNGLWCDQPRVDPLMQVILEAA